MTDERLKAIEAYFIAASKYSSHDKSSAMAAELIDALRAHKSIITSLAERFEVSESTVSRWASGIAKPGAIKAEARMVEQLEAANLRIAELEGKLRVCGDTLQNIASITRSHVEVRPDYWLEKSVTESQIALENIEFFWGKP